MFPLLHAFLQKSDVISNARHVKTLQNPAMWGKIVGLSIIYPRHSKICSFFPSIFKYCLVDQQLILRLPLPLPLFLMQPFCSSGSKFSFSVKQYISSKIIPVTNFCISGRQVIGLKFSTEFPFTGSFRHSTVLPYVIQDGLSFVPSSISFNWVTILSCILSSLFIQNPQTPSCPCAFQFGILLHCFFTLPTLITTFCCSNFTIFSFKSLNCLATLLCSFSTLYIPLQNVLLSSAFGMSLVLLPVCPLNSL